MGLQASPPAGRHQAQGRAYHSMPLSGDPWGPGCTPEGPGARHPLPQGFGQPFFHPQVSQGLALRRRHSRGPICVSASQRRVFASAGTPRLDPEPSHSGGTGDVDTGACSRHPMAGHSEFLDRQWVLTSQARWPARGRGQWACVSLLHLPAAALSPGAAREAEPSKAQRCT